MYWKLKRFYRLTHQSFTTVASKRCKSLFQFHRKHSHQLRISVTDGLRGCDADMNCSSIVRQSLHDIWRDIMAGVRSLSNYKTKNTTHHRETRKS